MSTYILSKSGADLSALAREAAIIALTENGFTVESKSLNDINNPHPLTNAIVIKHCHFISALSKISPSVSQKVKGHCVLPCQLRPASFFF